MALPTSPSRGSPRGPASCRMIGVVDEPCRPILCSSLPLVRPPNARSTMKAENCWPSTFAKDDEDVGKAAVSDHIFSPERRKLPSGWRVARALAPNAWNQSPAHSGDAPMSSPLSRRGRYFCFCASVPNGDGGSTTRLACAPKVAPNDTERHLFADDNRRHLVEASPPYSSATSAPIRPSAHPRSTNVRGECPVLLLETIGAPAASPLTESRTVASIRRCSSDNCSA